MLVTVLGKMTQRIVKNALGSRWIVMRNVLSGFVKIELKI